MKKTFLLEDRTFVKVTIGLILAVNLAAALYTRQRGGSWKVIAIAGFIFILVGLGVVGAVLLQRALSRR